MMTRKVPDFSRDPSTIFIRIQYTPLPLIRKTKISPGAGAFLILKRNPNVVLRNCYSAQPLGWFLKRCTVIAATVSSRHVFFFVIFSVVVCVATCSANVGVSASADQGADFLS